ncbi:uncharacterized protein LOC135837444 isoform X2 [Planococcus citri]|uniref:uncharacterized protein LOC135837444 isoform X2 n=1 Tax=Planococcus citri TaxID=170843 RepID=UPI0031F8703B
MFCFPCSQIKFPSLGMSNPLSGVKNIFAKKPTIPKTPVDGAAIKNLGEKAEGILEEQKKKVEELAIEKRNAAAAILEQQKEKIGDLLWQSKSDAENLSAEAKQAVDGFEDEIAKEASKAADDATQHVSSTVDEKLKETEEFLDDKREEAVKQASSAADSVLNPSAVLGKAKGFLNF